MYIHTFEKILIGEVCVYVRTLLLFHSLKCAYTYTHPSPICSSGVLQGCPLSSTLFVFVIDPLLCSFRRYLVGTITRTCADDIGMAWRRLEVLALVFKLFEDFGLVSLLTLKPAKCVLITSVCATSTWNVDMIRAFLRRNVPAWTSIKTRIVRSI